MKILLLTITILFLFIIDFYTLKALKSTINFIFIKSFIFSSIYWLQLITITALTIYAVFILKQAPGTLLFSVILTTIVLLYIPKLNIVSFYFIEYIVSVFSKNYSAITKIGISLSIVSFLLIIHGITINKNNFRLRTQEIYFKNLPYKFDGFKIIQISDIHLGSYGKTTKSIDKAVRIINTQNADIVLLTGDLVNNTADEVNGFEKSFKAINAKYGKYSILGNHDYGDYHAWKNNKLKQQNLKYLIQKHNEIGFEILLNSNKKIGIANDSITIAGVENWGKPPFPQHGDINSALQNTSNSDFIILLSHDPSHWRAEIIDDTNIELTLSGHTHAMQAGIEIGSFQWSPVSFKYKEWGGLYNNNEQYLYVNRGLGYLGLLGRIGIRPEITEIILRKK
ncbi:MAG: metallophosphoesterase [Flavobacteriaceae bacterium]|nr:metallophosphoesterase [Flavobacteriaceae bacterium]